MDGFKSEISLALTEGVPGQPKLQGSQSSRSPGKCGPKDQSVDSWHSFNMTDSLSVIPALAPRASSLARLVQTGEL